MSAGKTGELSIQPTQPNLFYTSCEHIKKRWRKFRCWLWRSVLSLSLFLFNFIFLVTLRNTVRHSSVDFIVYRLRNVQTTKKNNFFIFVLFIFIILYFFFHFLYRSGYWGFTKSVSGSVWHFKIENATHSSDTFGSSTQLFSVLLRDYKLTGKGLSFG